MIIFFDKRDGKIFGTVDGRVHDEEFTKIASMSSSSIPDEFVGKFVVPTKPLAVLIEEPIIETFANPNKNFKLEQKVIGVQKVKKIKELAFNIPFRAVLLRHEDPRDPLQLIKCKVIQDDKGRVIDIVETTL